MKLTKVNSRMIFIVVEVTNHPVSKLRKMHSVHVKNLVITHLKAQFSSRAPYLRLLIVE